MKKYICVICFCFCIFMFSSCLNRSKYEKECNEKKYELQNNLNYLDSINSHQHHEIDSLENRLDSLSKRLEWMKTHKYKYERVDNDILVRWVNSGDIQDLEDFVDEVDPDYNNEIVDEIKIPTVSGNNRNRINLE